MRRQDLDQALSRNNAPKVIMLYGESHFLIERYTKLLSNIADASVLSLYHSEYDFSQAKNHLSQGSLFGDQNLLIIKNEKKVPKSDLETLVALCAKNPDNILIYAYYGTDFKKSVAAAFSPKKGGQEVRFFTPYFNEAKKILMQESKQRKIEIDMGAIEHLLLSQNSDISLAYNELSKLQILNHRVTSKDIDELVYGLAEVKLDTFILKLLQRQDFTSNLQQLLEHGEDEIRIITAISAFVTQLYLFNIYIKIHGVASSVDILGYKLPAFIEKDRAALSIRYKHESYTKMITLLMQNELTMKSSGNLDKEAILISTLIELQGIIS